MNGVVAGCLGALGVAATLTMPVLAAAPFAFDSAPGRLPKDVIPRSYTIAVQPDPDALVLAGQESVVLEFRKATDTIVFNSLNEQLRDVRLDGRAASDVVTDDEQQITTVHLSGPARMGSHRLTFSYTGKVETQPHGLFLQAYLNADGSKGRLLSTKMESTDARRMFPCWDEPAFRSTFELTVTVPAAWTTVSNMPIAKRIARGAMASTTFQPSPRMPSYLIEFSAGDLAAITARGGNTALSVWAVRGREQNGALALANAKQILADYNDYFGYPYPLPKLDSIAVPGGFQGAMENWGAITFNDQLLLVTPASTMADRQTVFSVQAHEMAHQWNGDLVTMGWWDDLWLNESFASLRAANETDMRFPDWKWAEHQDVAKERAMEADAQVSTHPIQQHVADELQAANAFDAITYEKGQAVLRMFEAYLGPDVFRAGVRAYIKARAFSNATTADLWLALGKASHVNMDQVAAAWIEQPGFPLISVAASCDSEGRRDISLSQSRFLMRGTVADGSHWSVPLRIRNGIGANPVAVLLTRDGQSMPSGRCDEPLSVNADAIGFYRVSYDTATLAQNLKHFADLPDGDKIALLDDQWALVQSGKQSLSAYLALAASMGSDLDSRAWEQIAATLGRIEYDVRGAAGHDAFVTHAKSIVQPAAQRLGWEPRADESPGVQQLRRALIEDLGAWGDTDVIDQARARFTAFLGDHTAIRPDDQAMILGIVAQHADPAVFGQLHAIAKAAGDETEQQRYYSALMEVRDPQLARQSAQIAMSGEIPPQGAHWRLRLLVVLAQEHPQLAWNTFIDNSEALLSSNPKYAPLITSQYVPEYFWNAAAPDRIEAWVRAHVAAEMSQNVQRGMEAARFRLSEQQSLIGAIDAMADSPR
jgi:aminopeptidase N